MVGIVQHLQINVEGAGLKDRGTRERVMASKDLKTRLARVLISMGTTKVEQVFKRQKLKLKEEMEALKGNLH